MKFKFRNRVSLLTVAAYVVASIFVSGYASVSNAQGERCAHMFANADFKNEIKSSETHRVLMLNFVQQMQIELRSQMKDRMATFDRSTRLRNNIRESDIKRFVDTSPMLSQFEMAPFETGPTSSRIKPPMIDMEKPLDVGYFEWLKHNSLDFKLVDDGQMFQDGSYRPTMRQVEPLDLLRRYVEEGLSLDLSLKLVQAKLDPTLPNDAREAALSLRRLVSLDVALDRHVLPYLGIRLSFVAAHEAWRSFTGLPAARSNMMKLLESQVEMYGARFGRNDFERLVLALGEKPGYFAPMTRFLEQSGRGDLTPAEVAEVGNYLGEMKATLRLNPKIELSDLSMILGKLLPNPSSYSYEGLLADTFSPAGSRTPDEIRALRKIIEIAEAMKTREALVAYVETYIPAPRTP